MSMGYAIALSCIVLVIGLIACIAVLAWIEDMDINSTRCYGQNTYMVRIVTSDSKPIRAVQADYPDTFTFRDILWQLVEGRQIVRIDAFPLTEKQRKALRKEGVIV